MAIPSYKVLLIGTTLTGKSSIIQQMREGINDGGHRVIKVSIPPKYEMVELSIWDTVCLGEEASKRADTYQGAHAIVYLGSYDMPDSLAAITKDWPELIHQFIEPSSYIHYFAMNKCDIKGTEKSKVQAEEIQKTKEVIGVSKVFDISIQQNVGIKPLFNDIAEKLHDHFKQSK